MPSEWELCSHRHQVSRFLEADGCFYQQSSIKISFNQSQVSFKAKEPPGR